MHREVFSAEWLSDSSGFLEDIRPPMPRLVVILTAKNSSAQPEHELT